MLCMDDYFMVEVEKVEKDPETNKMVKKKVSKKNHPINITKVNK